MLFRDQRACGCQFREINSVRAVSIELMEPVLLPFDPRITSLIPSGVPFASLAGCSNPELGAFQAAVAAL